MFKNRKSGYQRAVSFLKSAISCLGELYRITPANNPDFQIHVKENRFISILQI